MHRRTFLSGLGIGWLASRLPILWTVWIAACSGGEERSRPESSDSPETEAADGFKVVGTIEELKAKGQILLERFSLGSVLLIPSPSSPSQVLAVNPTCTHQGCLVTWSTERKAFVCPCHGSAYGADGKVLQAPATQPLAVYTVRVSGEQIQIK